MLIPQLINDPFGDPGVYLELKHRKEAFLFDMGDLSRLSPRKILKVSHGFISHAHMDHFIGFDHFLRICLGRDQEIALFGPPGFMAHVESKFGAYTWNLVENYTNRLKFQVTEVGESYRKTARYECSRSFRRDFFEAEEKNPGCLVDREDLTVQGVLLDHQVPSLAVAVAEKQHIHIKKSILDEMNIPTGPWLTELKKCLLRNDPDTMEIPVRGKKPDPATPEITLSLGFLRERVVGISPGKKIAYVADALYSEENRQKIIGLASGASLLIIEAPFLQEDRERAFRKFHLTAAQAGTLAREAGARNLMLFHYSPLYRNRERDLIQEAREAFRKSG